MCIYKYMYKYTCAYRACAGRVRTHDLIRHGALPEATRHMSCILRGATTHACTSDWMPLQLHAVMLQELFAGTIDMLQCFQPSFHLSVPRRDRIGSFLRRHDLSQLQVVFPHEEPLLHLTLRDEQNTRGKNVGHGQGHVFGY